MGKAKVLFLLVCCLLYGAEKGILLKCEVATDSQHPESAFLVIGDAAVDEQGNLYVVDLKGCSLKKFSKDGRFVKKFGRKGQGPGEFLRPSKLYYYKGKLYVYDGGKRRLILLDRELNFLKELRISEWIRDFFLADGKLYASLYPKQDYYHFAIFRPAGNLFELERRFFNRKAGYIESNLRIKRSKIYIPLKWGYGSIIFGYSSDLSRIAAGFRLCTKRYRLFFLDLEGRLVDEKDIGLDERCRKPSFSYFLKGGKKDEMIEVHSIAFFSRDKLLIKYRYSAEGIEIGQDYLALVDLLSASVEGRVKLEKPVKLLGVYRGFLYLTKGEEEVRVYKCRLLFSGKGR